MHVSLNSYPASRAAHGLSTSWFPGMTYTGTPMAAMRSESGICGHTPWPPAHATDAASAAATASSAPICAIDPITARWPVVASCTGEVTSTTAPLNFVTCPPTKVLRPSTLGMDA